MYACRTSRAIVSTNARTSVCSVLCSWIWLDCRMLIERTIAITAKMTPRIAITVSISISVKPDSSRLTRRRWRSMACRDRRACL